MKVLQYSLTVLMLIANTMVSSADDGPLAENMDAMNSAYKAFRKTTDPIEGAQLAKEAADRILETINEVPSLISEMPDGKDKKKALADYRRLIAATYSKFCEVEIAFIDGDVDKAQELVSDLKALKKEGHKAYIED